MLPPMVNYDDTDDYQIALSKVQEMCSDFFNSKADSRLVFHTLSHTEYIVSSAEKIAKHSQVDPKGLFIVRISAYLYNLGFHKGVKHPEEESAKLAEEYLKKLAIPLPVINNVKSCILATRTSEKPQTKLEEIMCDAVFYFLGTKDFKAKSKLMRGEIELIQGIKISKKEWRQRAIQLLNSHKYYTSYCNLLLNHQKENNMQKLKSKDEEVGSVVSKSLAPVQASFSEKTSDIKGERPNKEERPEKGIETMFRISSANHLKLSEMADSKAHIMITVNAIIISVLISLLLRKLDSEPQLVLPAMLLLAVSLVTIVLSILATRPRIPLGTFTKEEINQKEVDLLFFGNYYKMSFTDYEQGMTQMMTDKEFLYGSLIKDLYGQGVVLGRKYRLLRISYSVFMYGLVAAVIAFALASVV